MRFVRPIKGSDVSLLNSQINVVRVSGSAITGNDVRPNPEQYRRVNDVYSERWFSSSLFFASILNSIMVARLNGGVVCLGGVLARGIGGVLGLGRAPWLAIDAHLSLS